jgi:uncharacterized membrane protein YdbT with pleckstrin-like domain
MSGELDWFSPDPGEEVVWTGQPRVWRVWKAVAAAVVLVAGGVGVAAAAALSAGGTLAAVGAVLGVALVAWSYLRVVNTDYVLTTDRVYRKQGILSERTRSVGLDRIQETTLSKDITGNLFDYGTVAISTAGSDGTDLALTDLEDPETFRDRLQEQVRAAGARADDARISTLDADRVTALTEEVRALRGTVERLEGSL